MTDVKVYRTLHGLIGNFSYDQGNHRVFATTPAIPMDTTQAAWLRSDSVSGGKDWLCCKTPEGIVTVWGKAWKAKQSNGPKPGDFNRLVEGKHRKGYLLVARFNGTFWQFSASIQNICACNADSGLDPLTDPDTESSLASAITVWVESLEEQPWF